MEYRYFIGIHPPAAFAQALADMQRQYFNPTHIMSPLQPHITLLPPPAVGAVQPDVLSQQAANIAGAHLPCPIALFKPLLFGKHTLAIEVVSPELQRLYRELLVILPANRLAHTFRDRPFRPHITICQARRGSRLPPNLLQQYQQAVFPLLPYTFMATRLARYDWTAPRTYTIAPL